MKLPLTALSLALALGFTQDVSAAGRDHLDRFTQGLRTLEGGFVQDVYDNQGGLKESAAGRVSLGAPNRLRWQYIRPYQQLIVADGETVWIYEPDLQQATRRSQRGSESGPLEALLNPARLDAEYTVTEAGSRDGMEWLGLAPKNSADASFQSAQLGFNQRGLAKLVFTDMLGQRTEMRFGTWRRNTALPASRFRFTPPQGVDVIGE